MEKGLFKFAYEDAAYATADTNVLPGLKVVSFGKLIGHDETCVRVALTWRTDANTVFRGLSIPRKAFLAIEPLDPRTHADIGISPAKPGKIFPGFNSGDTVAIYWNDIRVFGKDEMEITPTPMLTEGTLESQTGSHVIISNPETLNLRDVGNHPERKPRKYAIPASMIERIEQSHD